MSINRLMELERQCNHPLDGVGGYITCIGKLRAKTPAEMEDLLGFQKGTFGSGVSVWKLKSLPKADDFELRGYTYLPGGNTFDGTVIPRSGASRPDYFDQHGALSKYPPWLGIEQWEIRPNVILPATELERVPFGAKLMRWT